MVIDVGFEIEFLDPGAQAFSFTLDEVGSKEY
jgi:hypothetical protein